MQPQQNPSSLPDPQGTPSGQPATLAPKPPRSKAGLLVLGVVALAGLGWFAWRQMSPSQQTGGSGGSQFVRTAVVASGTVQRSIRLTGATTAENFASLTVPQLRGSRGGGGGGVQVSGGGGGMTITVTTGGGGGADHSHDTPAASGSSTGASSSGVSSGGSASGGSSSGFRGTTNRFGSGTSTSASSSSSGSTAASKSASSSSASSSGSSGGGGGGGGDGRMSGGMSDFMQVLQSVAKVGGVVKKGEQIAGFDTQYQLLRLDDYRATVEQDNRTLRSLDATLDVQRKAYQQSLDQANGAVEKAKLDIKTTPVRSQIEAETLKLALEETQAQLKQIQTQIPYQNTSLDSQRRISELEAAQSKQELKRAEKNVEKMTVLAPMDGMLVMESMMRGSEFSTIQQGDQLFPGQLFARVVDTRSMLVSAIVNQADVEFLRVNAKANLSFDAYPGLELPAHVVSIAAIPKPGGQRGAFVKEISVYLKLDKMDPRVIPDLSVSVDVFVGAGVNNLVAPLESVFQDGQNAKPYVFVKSGEGFEKREVEIGLRSNIVAAVVSGLKAGEVVALERPVRPGDVAPNQTAALISPGSLEAITSRRQQSEVGEFNVV